MVLINDKHSLELNCRFVPQSFVLVSN